MRTLNLKAVIVAMIVSIIALTANAKEIRVAHDKDPVKFEKEKTAIKEDLARIEYDKSNIKAIKEKCMDDRKAKDDMSVIMDRTNLFKAKADLKRDKMYLKADKKDLKRDHKYVIRERRQDLRDDRAELRKLKRDKMVMSAVIDNKKSKIKMDKEAIQDQRMAMYDDIIAVNQDIKEAKAGMFTFPQSAFAKTENWLMNNQLHILDNILNRSFLRAVFYFHSGFLFQEK